MSDELRDVEVYTAEEIVPIPARCTRKSGRRHDWVGVDAIRAPSLRNCLCFWCGSPLVPHPDYPPVVDAATRRRMSRGPMQLSLLERQP